MKTLATILVMMLVVPSVITAGDESRGNAFERSLGEWEYTSYPWVNENGTRGMRRGPGRGVTKHPANVWHKDSAISFTTVDSYGDSHTWDFEYDSLIVADTFWVASATTMDGSVRVVETVKWEFESECGSLVTFKQYRLETPEEVPTYGTTEESMWYGMFCKD